MDRRSFLGVALPAVLPAAVLAVPLPEIKPNFGLNTKLRHVRYPDSIYEIIGVISEQTESGTKLSYRLYGHNNYYFEVQDKDMNRFFERVA
jgi:hypothetical protein